MRKDNELPEEVRLFFEELEKSVGKKRKILNLINLFTQTIGVALASIIIGTVSWLVWDYGLVHISNLPLLPYWSFLIISLIHLGTVYIVADTIKKLKERQKNG